MNTQKKHFLDYYLLLKIVHKTVQLNLLLFVFCWMFLFIIHFSINLLSQYGGGGVLVV